MAETKVGLVSVLLKHMFYSSANALLFVGPDGTILAANETFRELSGSNGSTLSGESLSSFCVVSGKVPQCPPLREAWSGEVQWSGAQGVLPLSLSLKALPMGSMRPEGYLLRFSALSVGQEKRDELQFHHQKKLESIGVLASSVAHDLNNILTGVLGHISYLRLSMESDPTHRESVTAIEHGARRAASLTQQILDFARREEVELSTVNLSLVVAAGINLLRGSLPKDVELRCLGTKEDLYVDGDEAQLSQLVMNLTVNAKDALPNGGRIDVQMERVHLSKSVRKGEFELDSGTYAKLLISDNGLGIPTALLDRIFEPFFTTKSERGTGLGLATVYTIVKAHRGAITICSNEGEGTCFEVYLPESLPKESTHEVVEEAELPTGSERILVVDDEEAVRTVIQRSLELLGYTVVVASNGSDALKSFEGGGFQLVIIDMIMPNMSGDELFYKLRGVDQGIGVLVASGYSSDSRTKRVLEDGALGFIQKPFAVEELAQEVRRCIDHNGAARK